MESYKNTSIVLFIVKYSNCCQIITQNQGNLSNSFTFNHLYFLYRFTLSLHEYLLKKSNRMQKRATLQPPHKQNIRTAPLRGGRYQPNRTRCKLVMTVSLIGISKEKKNLSRTSRENVPTFLKNLYKFLENLYKFSAGLAESIFPPCPMLMQTSAEKQHDVENRNNDGNGVKHKRTPPRVGILPHDAP